MPARMLAPSALPAAARGIEVAETEIYGMVPAEALVPAAAHYLLLTDFESTQVLDLRLLDLLGQGEQ